MQTTNLGFPRIGPNRELKQALESYWTGTTDEQTLLATARTIREQRLLLQSTLLDVVPCNDFLYDHVLDTAVMLEAGDERVKRAARSLSSYFELARGAEGRAWEMTKWFDTNYHYLVPELADNQAFAPHPDKPVAEIVEAKTLGVTARPVLVGPVTFLMLSRRHGHVNALGLLERLLPAYAEVVRAMARAGATSIQLDEPALVTDLSAEARAAFGTAYEYLRLHADCSLFVATYFGRLADNLELVLSLPISGLHLDLVEGASDLEPLLHQAPRDLELSLGVIDGRNVFRADIEEVLELVESVVDQRGFDRLSVAPSCSLLHCPVDLARESGLNPELRSWLSFAKQKLHELDLLKRGVQHGRRAIAADLEASRQAQTTRKRRTSVGAADIARQLAELGESAWQRSPTSVRQQAQSVSLPLPTLPTTTIGSFPQTAELRRVRAHYKRGALSPAGYEAELRVHIRELIHHQEELGIDVLVHGEPERNDMVEYFAAELEGMALTEHAWVQSYGSRCVKPPVIYATVSRPQPMTVRWISFAQSLTEKPVKGILTGPVTMLKWSFVRDDQSRETTCKEIALALRGEVDDLVRAGIRVVQVDEPALREALPLRQSDRPSYLDWAVACFRLTTGGAPDATQVHSHMCYADFRDIFSAIIGLDVDVISLEAARSRYEELGALADAQYANALGPGLYDIHSPRVPSKRELSERLRQMVNVFPARQLWVNPDCGLKTRRPEEVWPSLENLVDTARQIRRELAT